MREGVRVCEERKREREIDTKCRDTATATQMREEKAKRLHSLRTQNKNSVMNETRWGKNTSSMKYGGNTYEKRVSCEGLRQKKSITLYLIITAFALFLRVWIRNLIFFPQTGGLPSLSCFTAHEQGAHFFSFYLSLPHGNRRALYSVFSQIQLSYSWSNNGPDMRESVKPPRDVSVFCFRSLSRYSQQAEFAGLQAAPQANAQKFENHFPHPEDVSTAWIGRLPTRPKKAMKKKM